MNSGRRLWGRWSSRTRGIVLVYLAITLPRDDAHSGYDFPWSVCGSALHGAPDATTGTTATSAAATEVLFWDWLCGTDRPGAPGRRGAGSS